MDAQTNTIIKDLAKALTNSIASKNTMTEAEFIQFIPLFKNETDKTTEAYSELCAKYNSRVSIYDPVTIINPVSREVIKVLPPLFNRVDMLDDTHADAVINKFEQAHHSNHPLRTDVEESLDIFKSYVHYSQNKTRLQESAERFAEIANAAGFTNTETPEDNTKQILDQIEWK